MIIRDSENRVHHYSSKNNWKSKRKNEILRHIFPIAAAAVVAVILVFVSFFQGNGGGETSAETAGSVEVTESEDAAVTAGAEEMIVEEPFVNILDKSNYELAVTWDGAVEQSVLESINASLEKEISNLTQAGYSASFLLYDLNTGGGISYHADVSYYSASAIKAPYVVWAVQNYPDTLMDFYSEIENAIVWSSNEDYYILINNFGKSGFNSWTAEAGSPAIELTDTSFSTITCRNFTRLWISIYDYFTSADEDAEILAELFSGTEESCIYETLGEEYTVYSKAGWYAEGEDSFYTVQNDAGIVMKGTHPYTLTVLSDAYERLDLLDPVVEALDLAHTELISQEE